MGYPSSWGEVGWAALDIADGFLLIASFGSSTPLSAAKGVAKSSLKAVEKNITRIPLRQAGRDILSAAAKRSWRLAAKNSVRFGAGLEVLSRYGVRYSKRTRSCATLLLLSANGAAGLCLAPAYI